MSRQKTFLLGLGAQKTGTTWLHRYLDEAPNADFGRMKEYHVLDARFIPACRNFRVGRVNAWEQVRNIFSRGSRPLLRYRLQQNLDAYADYFSRILDKPRIQLTGDLTPSYSGLGADALIEVKDLFNRRDINVKAVFIMRDPVERCWSSVRMARRRAEKSAPGSADPDWQVLEKSYANPQLELRTRYDKTIDAIETAFNPSEYRLFLFEELFRKDTMIELENFLGMDLGKPDFDRQVNVTKRQGQQIPDDLQRAVAQYYRPAYEAAFRVFGKDRVTGLWKTSRFLGNG
ncbi:MAG: sulfotransferase [Phyllobacteriaceae bacterium]|nr:sulfotransferase [Phyllobacteriaceae bacterium]